MHRRVIVGVAVLGVALAVAGLIVATPASSDGQDPASATQQTDEFNRTVFEITVYEDGTARWTVRHSQILADDEREQFRTFAEQFRTEELTIFQNFRARGERLAASGTSEIGRNMSATDFRRDAYIDERGQPRGIIEMAFNWTNFGTQMDQRVIVADVFSGGWAIIEEQEVVIKRGPGLVFERSPQPEPDIITVEGNITASNTVTWRGPREFADSRPRVILRQKGAVNGTQTDANGDGEQTATEDGGETSGEQIDDGTENEAPEGENGSSGVNLTMLALLGILVALLGAGGVAWYSGALARTGEQTQVEPTGATSDGAGGTGQSAGSGESEVTREKLVSDEDRIVNMLEANGGRMKQITIVEETDWSKSKVSMLLSDMEDEGKISKLRVGRENIISIAGKEPEAARSPFESEEDGQV
jgi:hypothetical protein